MPLPNLILLIGGLLGVTLLVVGVGVTVFGSRSVVEERLGRYAESGGLVTPAAQDSTEKAERANPLSEYFNRLGEGTDLFEGISRRLARADVKLRPAEYLGVIVASIIVGTAVGTILGKSVLFGVLIGIFGAFLPGMYVGRAEKGRLKRFDSQLGDMLNLMVNGLRAGFSTLQAMEAVSRELPAPICDEFRRVVQEMQLGLSMDDALEHLLRRIKSADLDLCVTAINVQREVGGNLAEILDVISFTIRERVRIKGEINSLTAQGRATAWVISAIPIVLVLLLYLINRPYIMQFFNPATRNCGIPMILLAMTMIGVGFWITQKIVTIDI
jgi:tight adherence protein B